MARATNLSTLGEVIGEELKLYTFEVNEKVYKAGQKAIKELERITKDTAPFNAGAYHKHYADLIASKSERRRTGVTVHTWYVKPPGYRLTHLLVHGHETKDGGRTQANPFLQNALDRVLPAYEKDIEEALNG
jgi:hypothetical protein